jgi:hypothetical protein
MIVRTPIHIAAILLLAVFVRDGCGGGGGRYRGPVIVPHRVVDQSIAEELKKLQAGKIAYNPPASMVADHHERVTARIAQGKVSDQELTKDLDKNGRKPQIEPVRISSVVRVTLSSPEIEVKALSPEEQFVDDDSPTEWQWDIVSDKVGRHSLRLAVIVRVLDSEKEFKVLDREIIVKVNPYYMAGAFFKGNWQWIVSFLIGGTGVGIGFFRWLGSKRHPPPPTWEQP